MGKKDLKNAKNKMIIIFVMIIFGGISILGFSYFSYKYFSEKSFEKIMFSDFINSIEKKEISPNDILNANQEFSNYEKNKKNKKNEPPIGKTPLTKGISYILFGKNDKILKYSQNLELSEDFLDEVLDFREDYFEDLEEGKKVEKIFYYENYMIYFFQDIAFLKEIKYTFKNFSLDFLGFTILNLLFSWIFYLIGIKFVNKIFMPVEENISDMKNFIHNAGHELKTPIAVIDSNIQLLLEMKTYDEDMIIELKKEILKLNSLLDSLIKLSDINTFNQKEKNNLSELLDDILKNFSSKMQEKNVTFEKNIPENIFVDANRNYLYIFVSNLIGNAIKYNKNDGKIFLKYEKGLIIEDTGIGISEEDLPKIFDRFFKADKSRNSAGFGIGLSLVAKIADIYNWDVKVESKENIGTKFFVKF